MTTLRNPLPLFALMAVSIATICVALLRLPLLVGNRDVAAWGATFDLTITIPLLWYIFVIRTGARRWISIVPLFVVCAAFAALVIPRGEQQFLHQLRFVVAPFEVVTLVLLFRRLAAVRNGRRSDDPYESMLGAAQTVIGNPRASAIVAGEIVIAWYAIGGWRRRPADLPRAFTVHERNGWGSMAACIVVLVAAESIGVHLLLQTWSITAAWIVTGLDLYGILWILGDYQALRLRRSWIDDGVLHLRYGLRWSADIALENIAAIEAIRAESEWKRPGVLKVAMLEEPRLLMTLREPVVAHGLAGFEKTISAVAISPDTDSIPL